MGIWQFIQDQVLGMKWLNELIGSTLTALGLNVAGRIGGSIHFFIYEMVDLGSFVLLISIFGTKVAVIYVLLGLAIAVIGGTVIEKLHMEKYIESFVLSAGSVDIDAPDLTVKDRLTYAKEQTAGTFKKVVLGSNNPFGVVLATLAGVPMYADIFGTIPVAEALLAKGAQLGTVLAFMMTVTTLSLPSLIMLRKAVKPKLLALFTGVCTLGIIFVGYLFNIVQHILI